MRSCTHPVAPKGVGEVGYNLTALLVANATLSFGIFYRILYADHRYVLGCLVLGQAALVLGLSRSTLRKKMNQYGIE